MDPNQYMYPAAHSSEIMDEHGNRYFQYHPDQYVFFVPTEHGQVPIMNSVIPIDHMKTKAKQKAEKPQRAYNSFIWYRKDKIKEVIKQNPDMSQTRASQLVAEMWRKEPENVKAIYKRKYEQHKREIEAAEAAKRQQKDKTPSPVPAPAAVPIPHHLEARSASMYGHTVGGLGLAHSQGMAPRIGRDCGTVNFLNGVPRSPWARRRSRTLPGSNLSDQLDGAIRNHRKKDSADLRRQATTHQATAVYSQPLNPAHMSMSPSMNPVNLLSLQSSPAMLPMSMPPMGHFDIPAAANGVAHSNYSSPMLNANDASMYFNPMAVTSGSIDAFPPMPAVASLPSSVNLQKAVSAEATLDPTAVAQAVAAVQQQQHHHHHGAGSPATNINGPTPGFQGFHGTYSWMSPTANSTSTSPDSQASALVNIATSNSALAPNTDLGLFSSAEMAAQAFSNIDWKSSTTPAGYEDPATKLTSLPTSSEADASSAQLPNSSA